MILKVTADGSLLSILASGVAPSAVTVDASNGDIYYNDGTALIWVESGASSQTVETGYAGIKGLVVNPSTHVLYISSSGGSVQKRTRGASGVGTLTTVSSGLTNPGQLALDSNGSLYVPVTGSYPTSAIKRITSPDMAPSISTFAGGGSGTGLPAPVTQFYIGNPRGVAVDPSDNVYIADTGSHFVEKVPFVLTPSAPVGLTLVGANSSIQVSFSAPLSIGGSVIDRYDITTDFGNTWAQISTAAGGPFTVNGLTNGNQYWVKARAHNSYGNGFETALINLTLATTAPGTPTGLVATSGNAQATLSFSAPASGGSAITGYEVSTDGGGTWGTLTGTTVSGSTVSAVLTGLANGSFMLIQVRAVNAIGHGAASAGVSVTPTAPFVPVPEVPQAPGAPSTPSAVAGTASVTVSWSAPSPSTWVTGYTVSASPGPAACSTSSAVATTCVIGAVADASFTYTVIAHSAAGDSPASGPSSAVRAILPPVPETLPDQAPATLTTTEGLLATVLPWQTVTLVGDGFAPYSTARVMMYSDPIVLGTVTTDAVGAFSAPVVIPTGLELGAHNLVATGVDPAGSVLLMRMPVDLVADTSPTAGPPTKISVSAGNKKVTISFAPSVARTGLVISGYQVSTDGGKRWGGVVTSGSTRLRAAVTGLINGTTYQVQIRALTGAGAGTASVSKRAKPMLPWFHDPFTEAGRKHQARVPPNPASYHGRLRTTKAAYRSHNGTLAVPAPWAKGHHLAVRQAANLNGAGLFRFDSAVPTKAGARQIRTLTASLLGSKAVTCEGYADYAGSARHERTLSLHRAQAICRALKAFGVHADMRSIGYGGAHPATIGGTKADRAGNRRAVVLVTR